MKLIPVLLIVFIASCTPQRYYIVRHAEKAVVTKDSSGYTTANPPLSEPGQVRAIVLRDELAKKHIRTIYSTNYFRTRATAQPLSEARGIPVQLYSPSKDSVASFIGQVKSIKKGSVLIVGHSNTVDDLVNELTGMKNITADLPESVYDNMYIITRKKDKYLFSQKKYGYPSNPEK